MGDEMNDVKVGEHWFDGDYSEDYYWWGEHVDKQIFVDWVNSEMPEEYCDEHITIEDVAYVWAKITGDDRFKVSREQDDEYRIPVTMYYT